MWVLAALILNVVLMAIGSTLVCYTCHDYIDCTLEECLPRVGNISTTTTIVPEMDEYMHLDLSDEEDQSSKKTEEITSTTTEIVIDGYVASLRPMCVAWVRHKGCATVRGCANDFIKHNRKTNLTTKCHKGMDPLNRTIDLCFCETNGCNDKRYDKDCIAGAAILTLTSALTLIVGVHVLEPYAA